MSILNDINGYIANYHQKIEDQRARNAVLQEKIDRLEAAKRQVNDAYHDAQNLTGMMMDYDPSALWAGDKYDLFVNEKTSTLNRSKNFERQIDTNYDAICDKITQLRNEMSEGWGLVSFYSSTINNLQNEWQKAWHDLFG